MTYQFGAFTLDPVRESLTGSQGPIPLRGTAFRVLRLLLERAPAVVSKEDILNEVWGHESLSESSIPQVIKDIRQALGDSAKSPEHIATRYGRGYKFVAPVKKIPASNATHPSPPVNHKSRASRRYSIALIAGMLLVGVLFLVERAKNTGNTADTEPQKWLIRAVDSEQGESLSDSFAQYLNFVIGSAAGGDRISLLREGDPVEPDANVIDISLAVDDNNPEGRFVYRIAQMSDNSAEQTTPAATDQPVQDSIEKILTRIEFSEETSIASGIVSQSPFATETLLRGMAAQFAGELDRAQALFEACLAEDPEFDFARYELAITLRRQGQRERSLALLQTLENRQSSPFWVYRINNSKGIVLRELGRYTQAADSLQIAVEHAETPVHRAIIAGNLGLLLRDQGDYERAGAVLESSFNGLDPEEYPRLIASNRNSLASIYMGTGRLEEALESLGIASELFYQADDRSGYASVLSRTAQVHRRLGQYSQSEHFLLMSTDVRRQLGQTGGVANGLVRLSRLDRIAGDFTQARNLANEALTLALESDNLISQQTANSSLAETAIAAGDFANAEIFAQRALDIAIQRGKPEAVLEVSLDLFDIEIEKGTSLNELPGRIQAAVDNAGESVNQHLQLAAGMQIARAHLQQGNTTLARNRLQTIRGEAQAAREVELEAEALIILAESYLDDDPQRTRQYLEQAEQLSPQPYPYLLLRAKNLQALGNPTEALSVALEARQMAGDWWRDEDQAFLDSLTAE